MNGGSFRATPQGSRPIGWPGTSSQQLEAVRADSMARKQRQAEKQRLADDSVPIAEGAVYDDGRSEQVQRLLTGIGGGHDAAGNSSFKDPRLDNTGDMAPKPLAMPPSLDMGALRKFNRQESLLHSMRTAGGRGNDPSMIVLTKGNVSTFMVVEDPPGLKTRKKVPPMGLFARSVRGEITTAFPHYSKFQIAEQVEIMWKRLHEDERNQWKMWSEKGMRWEEIRAIKEDLLEPIVPVDDESDTSSVATPSTIDFDEDTMRVYFCKPDMVVKLWACFSGSADRTLLVEEVRSADPVICEVFTEALPGCRAKVFELFRSDDVPETGFEIQVEIHIDVEDLLIMNPSSGLENLVRAFTGAGMEDDMLSAMIEGPLPHLRKVEILDAPSAIRGYIQLVGVSEEELLVHAKDLKLTLMDVMLADLQVFMSTDNMAKMSATMIDEHVHLIDTRSVDGSCMMQVVVHLDSEFNPFSKEELQSKFGPGTAIIFRRKLRKKGLNADCVLMSSDEPFWWVKDEDGDGIDDDVEDDVEEFQAILEGLETPRSDDDGQEPIDLRPQLRSDILEKEAQIRHLGKTIAQAQEDVSMLRQFTLRGPLMQLANQRREAQRRSLRDALRRWSLFAAVANYREARFRQERTEFLAKIALQLEEKSLLRYELSPARVHTEMLARFLVWHSWALAEASAEAARKRGLSLAYSAWIVSKQQRQRAALLRWRIVVMRESQAEEVARKSKEHAIQILAITAKHPLLAPFKRWRTWVIDEKIAARRAARFIGIVRIALATPDSRVKMQALEHWRTVVVAEKAKEAFMAARLRSGVWAIGTVLSNDRNRKLYSALSAWRSWTMRERRAKIAVNRAARTFLEAALTTRREKLAVGFWRWIGWSRAQSAAEEQANRAMRLSLRCMTSIRKRDLHRTFSSWRWWAVAKAHAEASRERGLRLVWAALSSKRRRTLQATMMRWQLFVHNAKRKQQRKTTGLRMIIARLGHTDVHVKRQALRHWLNVVTTEQHAEWLAEVELQQRASQTVWTAIRTRIMQPQMDAIEQWRLFCEAMRKEEQNERLRQESGNVKVEREIMKSKSRIFRMVSELDSLSTGQFRHLEPGAHTGLLAIARLVEKHDDGHPTIGTLYS